MSTQMGTMAEDNQCRALILWGAASKERQKIQAESLYRDLYLSLRTSLLSAQNTHLDIPLRIVAPPSNLPIQSSSTSTFLPPTLPLAPILPIVIDLSTLGDTIATTPSDLAPLLPSNSSDDTQSPDNLDEAEMEIDQPELRFIWITQAISSPEVISIEEVMDNAEMEQVIEVKAIAQETASKMLDDDTQADSTMEQDTEVMKPDHLLENMAERVSVHFIETEDKMDIEIPDEGSLGTAEQSTGEEVGPTVQPPVGVMGLAEVVNCQARLEALREDGGKQDDRAEMVKEVENQGEGDDKVPQGVSEEGRGSEAILVAPKKMEMEVTKDLNQCDIALKGKEEPINAIKQPIPADEEEQARPTADPESDKVSAPASQVDASQQNLGDLGKESGEPTSAVQIQEEKVDISAEKEKEVELLVSPSTVIDNAGEAVELVSAVDLDSEVSTEVEIAISVEAVQLDLNSREGDQPTEKSEEIREDDQPSIPSSSSVHYTVGSTELLSPAIVEQGTGERMRVAINEKIAEVDLISVSATQPTEKAGERLEAIPPRQIAASVVTDHSTLLTVHGPPNISPSSINHIVRVKDDLSSDPRSPSEDSQNNPESISPMSGIPHSPTINSKSDSPVSTPHVAVVSSRDPIIPLEPLPVSSHPVEASGKLSGGSVNTAIIPTPGIEINRDLIPTQPIVASQPIPKPAPQQPNDIAPPALNPVSPPTVKEQVSDTPIIPRPTFSTSALPAPISAISNLGLKRKNSPQDLFSAMPVPIKRKKVELRPKIVEVTDVPCSPLVGIVKETVHQYMPQEVGHDVYDPTTDGNHDAPTYTDEQPSEMFSEISPIRLDTEDGQTEGEAEQKTEQVNVETESSGDAQKGQWRVGRLPGHQGSHIRQPEVDEVASEGESGFKRGKKRSLGQSITESVEKVLKKPFRLPARVVLKSRNRSPSSPPAIPSSPPQATTSSLPLKNLIESNIIATPNSRINSRPFAIPRKIDKVSSMSPPSTSATHTPITPHSQSENISPVNFKASPTYSKRLSKPFKTPFTRSTAPSPHSNSIRSKARSTRELLIELEAEERTLRNAIKYHTQPEEDERLVELIRMWRESGQTVSELLFDVYPKPDPNDPGSTGDRGSGGDNSFFGPPEVEYTPEQLRAIARMNTNSDGDKVDDEGTVFGASGGVIRTIEGGNGENGDENGTREDGSTAPQVDTNEWNIGSMLAKMGVEADMYGWDADAEDWGQFEED